MKFGQFVQTKKNVKSGFLTTFLSRRTKMLFSTSKEVKADLIRLFFYPIFSYVYRTNFFICQIFVARFVHYTKNFSYVLCQNFVRPANFHLRQISIVSQIPFYVKFQGAGAGAARLSNFHGAGSCTEFYKIL